MTVELVDCGSISKDSKFLFLKMTQNGNSYYFLKTKRVLYLQKIILGYLIVDESIDFLLQNVFISFEILVFQRW